MTRTDTLLAISRHCRGSHAASLLAVGWLALDMPTDVLERLLEALEDQAEGVVELEWLLRLQGLTTERFSVSSRLD
jgi:hypothetical protein